MLECIYIYIFNQFLVSLNGKGDILDRVKRENRMILFNL